MKVSQPTSSPVQTNDTPTPKGAEAKGTERTQKAHHTKRSEKADAPAEASRSSTTGAETEISAKGKELAKAREVASSAPDVREEKIAEIKQRMAGGNFKVDPHAVAERMVDQHLAEH